MRPLTVITLAAGLLLAAGGPLAAGDAKEAARKELEKFQGTWRYASLDRDGKDALDEAWKAARLTVKGDKYTVEVRGRTVEAGTFRLDPRPEPKAIDLKITGGADKGQTLKGVYEVGKDGTVKVCWAAPGRRRPAGCEDARKDGYLLAVYRREKPR
jgi:uncharacterized protein (TIGR03067 family)